MKHLYNQIHQCGIMISYNELWHIFLVLKHILAHFQSLCNFLLFFAFQKSKTQ